MDETEHEDPADPHEHDPHEHGAQQYDAHQHDALYGEGDGEGGMFWRVTPGDAPALAAAYRSAVRQAGALSAALAAAGLADQVIAVTAGLDARGEPLVCGVITFTGARRLADLLASGAPPAGVELYDGMPFWAA